MNGCVRDVGEIGVGGGGGEGARRLPEAAVQDRAPASGACRSASPGSPSRPGTSLWGDEDGLVVGEPGLSAD